MRILHVAGYGVKMGVSGTALVLKSREGSRKVPLSEVDVVVVASSGVSISSRALRKLVSAGIELILLDARGLPVGLLYASHYTRTPATRRAQYLSYNTGLGVQIASAIARCKAMTQASVLQRLLVDFGVREARDSVKAILERVGKLDVERLPEALDEARSIIMGVEAEIARIYWSSIALIVPGDVGFEGRDRESGDPLNASLNYGYGILYGLAWRALVLAGLDPYAGFLHVDRSGKPVLAFDYVEMWRAPVIDEVLVRALRRGWRPTVEDGRLSYESRAQIASLIAERLRQHCPGAYRYMSFEEAIRGYALKLAESVRHGAPYRCYEGGWS